MVEHANLEFLESRFSLVWLPVIQLKPRLVEFNVVDHIVGFV